MVSYEHLDELSHNFVVLHLLIVPPSTPAELSQIFLLRVSDSFAPQEVLPYENPLPRVLTKLHVLLEVLLLLGIFRNLSLLILRFVFFHL